MAGRYDKSHQSGARPPDEGDAGKGKPDVPPPESDFEQLFQSLRDAAIITDLSGRILHANRRTTEVLWFARPELCEMTIPDIISGADADLIRTLCTSLNSNVLRLFRHTANGRKSPRSRARLRSTGFTCGQSASCSSSGLLATNGKNWDKCNTGRTEPRRRNQVRSKSNRYRRRPSSLRMVMSCFWTSRSSGMPVFFRFSQAKCSFSPQV